MNDDILQMDAVRDTAWKERIRH